MIYTSYFGNLKKLPKKITPIAICISKPQFWTGPQYTKIAPTQDILYEYKYNGMDWETYTERFNNEVLAKLSPKEVLEELKMFVPKGNDIALICYEKPDEHCHRHLVKKWFVDAGIECKEFVVLEDVIPEKKKEQPKFSLKL